MSIDFVTERLLPLANEEDLRSPSGVADYLGRLTRVLQKDILPQLIMIMNLQLSLMNVGVYYFTLPDPATGVYADGTWRLREIDDDNFAVEHKVSGAWILRFVFR